MDFQEYHYVLAISEYRNISRAAKELYISQPQLSRFLTRLETRLGVALFDRSRTPLQLTYAGERYVEYAHQILNIEHQMQSEFDDITVSRAGNLVIGISRGMSRFFIPEVLPHFHHDFPHVQISLRESSTARIQNDIQSGMIDLGIYASTNFPQDIVCEVLQSQQILLVVPQNHPLYYLMTGPSYKTLNMKDMQKLDNEPFILLLQEEGMAYVSKELFNAYNLTPQIILKTQDAETAFLLAASGMGLTFSSDLQVALRKPYNPYCCYKIGTPPYTRTWVIAHQKDLRLSRAARHFIQLSKKHMAEVYSRAIREYETLLQQKTRQA
ncbi:MAG: LysR family transcriptional regulator [Dehalobacterium sp.]